MTRETVFIALIVAAAIPANLFCVLYTYWKNWWKGDVARHLFFLVAGLAALIDLSLIRRTIGEFPGYLYIAMIAYALLCYQLYRRLWFLIKYNSPWGERRIQDDSVEPETIKEPL